MINTQYTEVMQTNLEKLQDAQVEDGLSERFEQAMSIPEGNNGLEGGLLENISELKKHHRQCKKQPARQHENGR